MAYPSSKLIVLVFMSIDLISFGSGMKCIDRYGNKVGEGISYHPDKNEPCQECVCWQGIPIGCTTAWCAPPECDWKQVEGSCCQFECRPGGPLAWLYKLLGWDRDDEVVLDGTACVDGYGRNVRRGEKYIPYNFEDCVMCTCDGGPKDCTRVKCVPPKCRKWENVRDECCKFTCIDE